MGKKNTKNDDVISRRRFFRRAANMIIPALGLAMLPQLFTSCEIDEPYPGSITTGCNGSCSGKCSTSCAIGCATSCTADCRTLCKGNAITIPSSCNHSCKSKCYGSCASTCSSQTTR